MAELIIGSLRCLRCSTTYAGAIDCFIGTMLHLQDGISHLLFQRHYSMNNLIYWQVR